MKTDPITHYYCHDHPTILSLETPVLDVAPGKILVTHSPFFPGGGGQLADRGVLRSDGESIAIADTEVIAQGVWHTLANNVRIAPVVELIVDSRHRALQSELHTLAHIVNAVVYRSMDGALLTGAQLNDDGTFRVDFDLPGIQNSQLRSLEADFNAVIKLDIPVTADWMPWETAAKETGLFRSKSALPPAGWDGQVRIVQIGDIDRQACGGTHVLSTGMCRPVNITKIENKGRQNRRIRLSV